MAFFADTLTCKQEEPPRKKFRAQWKHGMLTYSCPTTVQEHPIPDKETIMTFLKNLRNYDGCVVSKELHADGKVHYHAYIRFQPKCDTINARYFDINGVHPNITHNEGPRKMINYVIKDGDYIADKVLIDAKTKTQNHDEAYANALKLAGEGHVNEAHAALREGDPSHYCRAYTAIAAALKAEYERNAIQRAPVVIKETNWCTDDQFIDLNAFVGREDYKRTHILVGPAGIGKTQLAKYLLHKAGCKRIAVVRQVEQMREYKDADGIVFDELNVNAGDKKWEREAQVGIVCNADNASLPARYGNIELRSNVLRVITTNVLNRCIDFSDAAIARRITVHELTNQLYRVDE